NIVRVEIHQIHFLVDLVVSLMSSKFAATEAYNKIKNLPKHKELKIKLRIHFFDLWEDDSLFLQVDNKTIWT
ncbi:hypothetical protein PFNF54_03127, partial [Plasmodium falciparum NF54]